MNLHELLLTENNCFKANQKMTPKGIMMHSTGANNQYLKRYVGPDDGLLGYNRYNNHWNQPTPDGRQICAHAFIGRLKDNTIATYQTLPWNLVGWHSGSGSKGSANYMGYIGIEICEDDKHNLSYYQRCVDEFVDVCAMLCKLYNIDPDNITTHKDAHAMGIASNHGDPYNWSETLIKDGCENVPTVVDVRRRVKSILKSESLQEAQHMNVFSRVYIGEYPTEAEARAMLKDAQKTNPGSFIVKRTKTIAGTTGKIYSVQMGAFACNEAAERYVAVLPYRFRVNAMIERS